MSKKSIYALIAVIVVFVFALVMFFVNNGGLDRAAKNTGGEGQDVNVPGNGSGTTLPEEEEGKSETLPPVATSNNGISVTAPAPYGEVTSPVIVAGSAIAFENTVSMLVRDARGTVLGRGFATADAPDVGQSGVYRTSIAFNAAPGSQVFIEVFEASAKDGTPIHMVRIPVFVSDKVTNFSVFFAKEGGSGCPRTSAVGRSVPETVGVARAALEQVIVGPTREEQERGYRSFVPTDAVINQLVISGGVATVDFSGSFDRVLGACNRDTARVQIEKTLLQFSTVTSVVLSVNGDKEAFLQESR